MAQTAFGPIPVPRFDPLGVAQLGEERRQFNALLPIEQAQVANQARRTGLLEREVQIRERQQQQQEEMQRSMEFGQMAEMVLGIENPRERQMAYTAAVTKAMNALPEDQRQQFDNLMPENVNDPMAPILLRMSAIEGQDTRLRIAQLNARTEAERLQVERERQNNTLELARLNNQAKLQVVQERVQAMDMQNKSRIRAAVIRREGVDKDPGPNLERLGGVMAEGEIKEPGKWDWLWNRLGFGGDEAEAEDELGMPQRQQTLDEQFDDTGEGNDQWFDYNIETGELPPVTF